MKNLKLASLSVILVLFVLFSLFAITLPVNAQSYKAHVDLPFEQEGTHNATEYRIRVPANWNGTLLVYVHGWDAGIPPPPVQIAPG